MRHEGGGWSHDGFFKAVEDYILSKLKDLDKTKKYTLNVLSIDNDGWINKLTATINGRNLTNFSSSNVILEWMYSDNYYVRIGKVKNAKFRGLNYIYHQDLSYLSETLWT